jgi:hypothetical protein
MTIRGKILHDERIFGETEQDPSPQIEMIEVVLSTVEFIAAIAAFVFIVGLCLLVYGLTIQHPSTVCMVKQVFGFCK